MQIKEGSIARLVKVWINQNRFT